MKIPQRPLGLTADIQRHVPKKKIQVEEIVEESQYDILKRKFDEEYNSANEDAKEALTKMKDEYNLVYKMMAESGTRLMLMYIQAIKDTTFRKDTIELDAAFKSVMQSANEMIRDAPPGHHTTSQAYDQILSLHEALLLQASQKQQATYKDLQSKLLARSQANTSQALAKLEACFALQWQIVQLKVAALLPEPPAELRLAALDYDSYTLRLLARQTAVDVQHQLEAGIQDPRSWLGARQEGGGVRLEELRRVLKEGRLGNLRPPPGTGMTVRSLTGIEPLFHLDPWTMLNQLLKFCEASKSDLLALADEVAHHLQELLAAPLDVQWDDGASTCGGSMGRRLSKASLVGFNPDFEGSVVSGSRVGGVKGGEGKRGNDRTAFNLPSFERTPTGVAKTNAPLLSRLPIAMGGTVAGPLLGHAIDLLSEDENEDAPDLLISNATHVRLEGMANMTRDTALMDQISKSLNARVQSCISAEKQLLATSKTLHEAGLWGQKTEHLKRETAALKLERRRIRQAALIEKEEIRRSVDLAVARAVAETRVDCMRLVATKAQHVTSSLFEGMVRAESRNSVALMQGANQSSLLKQPPASPSLRPPQVRGRRGSVFNPSSTRDHSRSPSLLPPALPVAASSPLFVTAEPLDGSSLFEEPVAQELSTLFAELGDGRMVAQWVEKLINLAQSDVMDDSSSIFGGSVDEEDEVRIADFKSFLALLHEEFSSCKHELINDLELLTTV